MNPDDPPASQRHWDFSGRHEFYDNGLVRLRLPANFQMVGSSESDGLQFEIEGLPARIRWNTLLLDEESAEHLGAPWEDVEGSLAFFLHEPGQPPLHKPTVLSSGFLLLSNISREEGNHRARCMLGRMLDDQFMLFAEMELSIAEGFADHPSTLVIAHTLRDCVRHAQCSVYGPRIDSARDWLTVDSLATTFPEEIGGLTYEFAIDYSRDGEPENLGLRFSDEDGRHADLYIFTCGEEFIEPGIGAPFIHEHLADAVEDIRDQCAPRTLVKILEGDRTYGRGDVPFLFQAFLLGGEDPSEESTLTSILLTARMDRFLKVRFTATPGETSPDNPVLQSFMEDLAEVVSR